LAAISIPGDRGMI